jgi:hypothetical protein
MNHDEQTPDMNALPAGHLAIDALLDGEAVDKNVLRTTLDDDGARDYLVEALLLRQMTRDMGPQRFVVSGRPQGLWSRGARWIAACAVLAVGTGGGYLYGQRSQVRTTSFEVVADNTPAPAAPQPTHTIRFEPGVNWTSTSGSN